MRSRPICQAMDDFRAEPIERSIRGNLENAVHSLDSAQTEIWPDTLTYYCSPTVAESIFRNGSLWLTDIRKMNDRTELDFAMDYIGCQLGQLNLTACNPQIIKLANWAFPNILGPSREWQGTTANEQKVLLAICLSALPDDLNMWRAYGANGKGFAVHFDRETLLGAHSGVSSLTPGVSRQEGGVIQVCYPKHTCNCLNNLVDDATVALSTLKNKQEAFMFQQLFLAQMLRLVASHKSPHFQAEQEYRLFQRQTTVKSWHGSDYLFHHDDSDRAFHYSKIFIPHQAINIDPEAFWNNMVTGVTAGPLVDEAAITDVLDAMQFRGIDHTIKRSVIPLRH